MKLNEDQKCQIQCDLEDWLNERVRGWGGDDEDYLDILEDMIQAYQDEAEDKPPAYIRDLEGHGGGEWGS